MNEHRLNRVVRFDVPGHKGGRGNRELAEFLGEKCVKMDVNYMKIPKMVLFDYGQTLIAEKFDGLKGTEAVLQYAKRNKYHL